MKLITGGDLGGVVFVEACGVGLDFHIGIELIELRLRRFDLLPADVCGGVQDLALQIGQLDFVGIDDAQSSDAGGSKIKSRGRTQPAGADDQHARLAQLDLPLPPMSGTMIWRL